MKWPDNYWPKDAATPDENAWGKSVAELKKDRAAFEKLLKDGDLTEAFPWGDSQNLLREAQAGTSCKRTRPPKLARR
jgi:hypothetical protein